MIDYSKYGELMLADFDAVCGLVKEGWVILDTVDVSVPISLSRGDVLSIEGNSYPQTGSFSDQAVGITRRAILGKPLDLVKSKWQAEHDLLMAGLDAATKERDEAKAKVLAAEVASNKLKAELGEAKVKGDDLQRKYLSASATVAAQMVELNQLKAGMANMVSKVGGATLTELITQDQVMAEIEKAAESTVEVKQV